jgi:hypothetical protein
VAAAVESGALSVACANAITSLLGRVACRIDRAVSDAAEQTLVEQAAGLSLSEVQVILRRAEAWLDPDGLEPKIENLRAERYLKIWEDQHGMINLDARFDPATGAPIKTAIDALVTAQIRALRGHHHPDTTTDTATPAFTWSDTTTTLGAEAGARGSGDGMGDGSADGEGAGGEGAEAPVERRTVQQLQADALAALAKHSLGCDQTALPLAATTIVVRIPLDALTTDTSTNTNTSGTGTDSATGSTTGSGSGSGTGGGVATIDGITQPIDAGTARRLAADAEIIPLVLGANSEVLDYGRSRRLFSKTQRLALWERDGGCAGCGAPPTMTEAHHLTWWSQHGTTNLDNGILLCTSCHHTIHKDDWHITTNGPHVWFTPPAHIDPTRTPRPGGRRRYDYHPTTASPREPDPPAHGTQTRPVTKHTPERHT